MKTLFKKFALPIIILSLLINLILVVYVIQVERNYNSNVKLLKEKIELLEDNNDLLNENNENLNNNISELKEKKEYYQNKYYDYWELSEELQNQIGVY